MLLISIEGKIKNLRVCFLEILFLIFIIPNGISYTQISGPIAQRKIASQDLVVTNSVLKSGENIYTPITKFILYNTYPAPFNSTGKIKFDIPISINVSIDITNEKGKPVSILLNKFLHPGTYTLDWDASGFPDGIYYYTLTADNYSITKAMLIIK